MHYNPLRNSRTITVICQTSEKSVEPPLHIASKATSSLQIVSGQQVLNPMITPDMIGSPCPALSSCMQKQAENNRSMVVGVDLDSNDRLYAAVGERVDSKLPTNKS